MLLTASQPQTVCFVTKSCGISNGENFAILHKTQTCSVRTVLIA